MDASIHLAPVPVAGNQLEMTRVPAAVGGLLLPPTASHGAAGWAAARSLAIQPGTRQATNLITWQAAGRSGARAVLSDLVAKVMPAQAAKQALNSTATQLLYEIEWQAEGPAPGATHAAPAAAIASSWVLRGSMHETAVWLRTGPAHAASLLHLAQQAVGSSVQQAAITACIERGSAPVGQTDDRAASAMAWGVAKVAALEAPALAVGFGTDSALATRAAGITGGDAFGIAAWGAVTLAAKLLRSGRPTKAHNAWDRGDSAGSSGGAVVITGGLGALGMLVASHEAQATRSPASPPLHLWLLGRTVPGAGIALPAALTRLSGAVQVTVVKCDTSAAADMAGVHASLSSHAARLVTVHHAAGVLKVGVHYAFPACEQEVLAVLLPPTT